MIYTLNKYLTLWIFKGIFIAFIIITGIIILVDFVETSRNLGTNNTINSLTKLSLAGLNAPQLVEKTIPFAILFGVMGTLFSLNKRSEFIIMRAAGLSVWKFLKPAMFMSAIIGIIWTFAFNPLAAISARKHQAMIAKITGGEGIQNQKTDIWIREGNEDGHVVIHAKSANIAAHEIYNVTFYYFFLDSANKPKFTTRYDAKSAKLHKNNYWVITDLTENVAGKPPQYSKTRSIPTSIDWETLRELSSTKNMPSFWNITSEIKKAKQAGFDTTRLYLQFNKLLALPVLLLAMTIIAACAAINLAREGGTLRLLIAGGTLGFGVYFTDNIISAFGETGALPPMLAAWSVPILVLCLGIVFLSKMEDG
ncbi:MAG: LPS export ABC transporter permease LptG [Robiginitomaculum sp.]